MKKEEEEEFQPRGKPRSAKKDSPANAAAIPGHDGDSDDDEDGVQDGEGNEERVDLETIWSMRKKQFKSTFASGILDTTFDVKKVPKDLLNETLKVPFFGEGYGTLRKFCLINIGTS